MQPRTRALVCLWATLDLVLAGCRPPGGSRATTHAGAAAADAATGAPRPSASGRVEVAYLPEPVDVNPRDRSTPAAFTLALASPAGALGPSAAPTPLSADATAALLARLEPLPAGLGNPADAAPVLRPATAPPVVDARRQPIAFPTVTARSTTGATPPAPSARAPLAPLAPPELQPVGPIAGELEVRVRFTEPMVPVAKVGPDAAPPAHLSPAVPGVWRWIDTRVLTFFAASALPSATSFTLVVPAGTRALSGKVTTEEARATFTTPPVRIHRVLPDATLRPDSPIVVTFNQDVDPAAIVPLLRVVDHKDRALPFRIGTMDEAAPLWARNPSLQDNAPAPLAAIAAVPNPRRIVLVPTNPWPAGREPRVILAAGAPSAEGPVRSTTPSVDAFTVATPFTMLGIRCRDDQARPRLAGLVCPAGGLVGVEFSNPIDGSEVRARQVQLRGLPFEDHPLGHESVLLTLPEQAGRALFVDVTGTVRDIYGQPLIGPRSASFRTGRPIHEPWFEAPSGLVVLDPRFEIPQWRLTAQAVDTLHVQLYAVQPADYFGFLEFEAGRRPTPPGRRVFDRRYPVGPRSGADLRVDLRPALAATGTGHVIAVARANPSRPVRGYEFQRTYATWFQVTRLGVTTRVDGDRAHAWVHGLTGPTYLRPQPGVTTSLVVQGPRGPSEAGHGGTDGDGHAVLELLPASTTRDPDHDPPAALLVALAGTDSAFVAMSGGAERAVRSRHARWFVTDDRFLYKPGEALHLKGWIRWSRDGAPGLELPSPSTPVRYVVRDAGGTQIATGQAALTDRGGFDLTVTLPAEARLGTGTVALTLGDEQHRHQFQVQEFRAPAFAVSLDEDLAFHGARPLVVGERLELSASASYYAGGGLPGAGVEWQAELEPASYRPPGWDRYGFDPPERRSERRGWRRTRSASLRHELRASLGASSSSTVQVDLSALPGREPSVLHLSALVTDLDRMTIRARAQPVVVHPSTLYVGLRLQPGHTDVIEAIVTDIAGAVVPGVAIDVEVTGVLPSEASRDDADVIAQHRCTLTSAASPARCRFPRTLDHSYDAIATVVDARGRRNRSQLELPWWSGPTDEVDLALSADRPSYRPGEVARVTIHSRQTPASAVLTTARGGVLAQRRLELTSRTTVVEVPIDASHVPDLYLQLDRLAARAVAGGNGKDPKRPARPPLPIRASTELMLPVDLEAMRLSMRAAPTRPLVEPGRPATFEVEVSGDDGPVAGAEVALMVVDEAVLAVSGRSYADPLAPFYRALGDGTQVTSNLDWMEDAGDDLDAKPGFERYALEEHGRFGFGRSGYGSGGGAIGTGHYGTIGHGAGSGGAVEARKDLRANAAFAPRLRTDARGRATLTVKMPDNLTRFRVVAFAAAGTGRFGRAEGTIVTQRMLSVRTVAPRALAQGDRFDLPVLVQNLGAEARTVDVAARAGNLNSTLATGQRITIPPGQRVELRFPMATTARGPAAIQTILHADATATSAAFDDASLVTLPVYEPATTESFATYGVVDDAPQVEQLVAPTSIFPGVGGVEVEVSSSQVGELTDAFWYLIGYPYECAEQRSARMLATASMFDLLDAFATPGRMTRAELERTVAEDVRTLARTQNPDGGWGYFRDLPSDRFVTAQVVRALASRTVAGRSPPSLLDAARAFLRSGVDATLADLSRRAALPVERRVPAVEDATHVTRAAVELGALAAAGADVDARVGRLHAAATTLGVYPVEARARVLALMAGRSRFATARAELLRALRAATHETAATATVSTPYSRGERLLLASDVRTSALTLDALMREAPTDPRIDKLARGALAGRRRGRWSSTQDNLAVLAALRRYFDTYERAVPAFTGKLWLGQAAYAERAFVGRSAARAQAQAGWRALGDGAHDLTLAKDGPGRLYYRVGITYAPRQRALPGLDAGFVVTRRYRAIDDRGDVRTDGNGQVHVRLGARVVVELEVSASAPRDGVALVDPIPAGFEAVNTALATSEGVEEGADDARGWDHRTFRDNRTEAFRMAFPEGTSQLSYTVRATTPGTFLAAPAKAEEMYSPETFGRSSSAVVIVE